MEIKVTQTISAPRELAFDLMADVRNEVTWQSNVTVGELTSSEPIGEGATFHTVNRGQDYVGTITTYDRPSELVFDVVGKGMDIAARLTFAEEAGATRLDGTFDMRPKGVMKVLLPLMAPMVRRDFPKQMASFAALCESRAG